METETKNKNLAIIIVVIILVLAIIFIAWKAHEASSPTLPPVPANTVDQTALTPVATEDTTTGDINAGKAVSLSYTDALVKYANARLQLDTTCQALASPSNLIFKNNALLMVDNRAPVARTVHIGSVFSIKAYGFKIIQLYSAKLPATFLVDCGTSQNVATITLEK